MNVKALFQAEPGTAWVPVRIFAVLSGADMRQPMVLFWREGDSTKLLHAEALHHDGPPDEPRFRLR